MKNILLTLFVIFISLALFSQKSPNRFYFKHKNYFNTKKKRSQYYNINHFSIGLNYGKNGSFDVLNPINITSSNNVVLSARYFINPYYGINGKIAYDRFNSKNELQVLTNYADSYLNVFFDLGKLIDFKSRRHYKQLKRSPTFQLFIYAGPGLATMWCNEYDSESATDPYLKNHDDILNFNIGLMPELKLGKNISVNLDFSFKSNYLQDREFDYSSENIDKKSKMYTFLIGVNYLF